jgi:fructosamine-3-kinase
MNSIIQTICELNHLQCSNCSVVSGGDINDAYALNTSEGRLFLKINDAAAFPQMFSKEAEGLQALQQASLLKVPGVIANGEEAGKQYLILEWLERASPPSNFWQQFAEGVAQLHQIGNDTFGWSSFNYIGSLQQQNNEETSWTLFYASHRIMPLVKQLFDKKLFAASDVIAAEQLCKRLDDIFTIELPALLHGDLWSGNFLCVENNGVSAPAIFDPAVYYGHREMDIGMSLLFGGFDNSFYDFYSDCYPLEKNWRQRVPLTQLYPLLVHAILFGGGYVQQCKSIIQQWQ